MVFHLPRNGRPAIKHQNTLLDGELVEDFVPERKLRFLIYDAMAINGEVVRNLHLLDRLRRVYLDVIQPLLDWEKSPSYDLQKGVHQTDLSMYLKDFFDIFDIDALNCLTNKLPHPNDGFVFTPVLLPYIPGTCFQLLKWKPPRMNTVDFALKIVDVRDLDEFSTRRVQLLLAEASDLKFCGHWLILEDDTMSRVDFSERPESAPRPWYPIWECQFDENAEEIVPAYTGRDSTGRYDMEGATKRKGGWCLERQRTDKSTPNNIGVFKRIQDAIDDAIKYDDLKNEIEEINKSKHLLASTLCKNNGV